MVFVNRKKELETLKKQYELEESSFVVIYGRRRVGKTSLINEFIKENNDSLFFLATEESEYQNLKNFIRLVGEYTHNDILSNANIDWFTAFKELVNYKTKNKKIIVIDEFQYLGQSNSAFPSIMQKIWDLLLKDSNVMLILCGSLVSLMKSQTLDYSSPLYGRRTAQIKLRQIPFEYYKEFFNSVDEKDLIPFYAVTGGVPKYIEFFKNYNNIYDAIRENILSSQSFLFEEPYFLLQKEVSEIGSYFSLIRSIAFGNRKLSDIARDLGLKQTGLTKYLKVLTDLDLIEREVPVTEPSPTKSKSGLYKIKDNFIAFWFKYVFPYQSYLENNEYEFVLNKIKESFIQNSVSFVYEDICREKIWDMCAEGTLNCVVEKVGRYWGPKTGETDIVAIDSHSKTLVVGECKYSTSKKGLPILNDLKNKAKVLKEITNAKKIYFVLFCPAGFTEELINIARESNDIILVN